MIFVKRSRAPAILICRNGEAAEERAAAAVYFQAIASGRKPKVEFKGFKIYSHPEVKSALLALFNEKCAYCEIDYGGSALDVEHFRPKNAIVIEVIGPSGKIKRERKRGYYWLASDWHNLLPSCQDCNRPRTHHFPGGTRVSGKANYFPLALERKRASEARHIAREEPHRLLLDPCRDKPDMHLEFFGDGLVRAKKIAGKDSPKGVASIKHYGLLRRPLVLKRKEKAARLSFLIKQYSVAMSDLRANPKSKKAANNVAEFLSEINTYLEKGSPFLALARTLANPILKSSQRQVRRHRR